MQRIGFVRTLYQIAFALLMGAGLWMLVDTARQNIARKNIASGFDFLGRPASFNFGESLIAISPSDGYGWALFTGFVNSLWVSILACILSTVLGVTLAGASQTKSFALRGFVKVYVEIFRNTPLLLQLLVWYALLQTLPPVIRAIQLGDFVFVSQRGLALPALDLGVGSAAILLVATLVWVAARAMPLSRHWTGLRRWVDYAAALSIAIATLTGLSVELPKLSGLNFRGGWHLSPEFLALLIGLTLYSAAFISEIVRGGIEAVPKGQWEAAASLGLGRLLSFVLVVLPQVARVAIPPLVSEYGGIVKNSSLAVAIGYPDLFWATNTTITQTGRAIEGVVLMTVAYLAVSLSISGFLSVFNKRARGRYA